MPKVTSAARNTASAVGKRLPCCSSISVNGDARTDVPGRGRRFLCGAWPSKVAQRKQTVQAPKLKFDRVDISTKMTEIVQKLKPICAKVSTILNLELLGSKGTTTTTLERPTTSEEITEPKLYGRKTEQQVLWIPSPMVNVLPMNLLCFQLLAQAVLARQLSHNMYTKK